MYQRDSRGEFCFGEIIFFYQATNIDNIFWVELPLEIGIATKLIIGDYFVAAKR